MDPSKGTSEPGYDGFRDCPECGKDGIYTQSDGLLSKKIYLCDYCGSEVKGVEVKKTFKELIGESVEAIQKGTEPNIPDSELRQEVIDKQDEGWKIEEITNSGEKVILSKTKSGTPGGHALTGALTGIWTLGLGNAAYDKISKKRNKKKMVLRSNSEPTHLTEQVDSTDPIEIIRELRKLREEGTITETEFKEKKQEMLDEI